MDANQIYTLRKNLEGADPVNRAQAEQVYDLALLGIWARDHVMPFMRRLPPKTEIVMQDGSTKSTVEAEVSRLFDLCKK